MIRRHIANILGKTTNRHLLAFFVDDYGAIVNKTKKRKESFLKAGGSLMNDRFFTIDCLETNEDIEALYDVLTSFKDIQGKNVAWTPLCVPANPDFDRIKSCDYCEYYYEPINVTFAHTPGCENVMNLELEGISNGIFVPQYHGREHINVRLLMDALISNHADVRLAFNYESLYPFLSKDGLVWSNQAYKSIDDKDTLMFANIINDGITVFEKVYGYKPIHFNAPGERENSQLLKVLANLGIKYVETDKIKRYYQGSNRLKTELHWNGEVTPYNQHYIIRNCVFEPTSNNSDWASITFKQIDIAFKWKKAAVVSTHRVNFSGAIDETNRARGLSQLKKLIGLVKNAYPDVEFVTSYDLFKIMYE